TLSIKIEPDSRGTRPGMTNHVYHFRTLKYFRSGGGWSLRMGMMVPSPLRKLGLLDDHDVSLPFGAIVFTPPGLLGAFHPTIGLHHRPRPRQRIVDRGHLVAQNILVVLVEREALLDDRLVIVGHRHARLVPHARAADVAGLGF